MTQRDVKSGLRSVLSVIFLDCKSVKHAMVYHCGAYFNTIEKKTVNLRIIYLHRTFRFLKAIKKAYKNNNKTKPSSEPTQNIAVKKMLF